jgi:hypothetical protein
MLPLLGNRLKYVESEYHYKKALPWEGGSYVQLSTKQRILMNMSTTIRLKVKKI